MSADTPQRGWNSKHLALTAVLLAVVLLILSWVASKAPPRVVSSSVRTPGQAASPPPAGFRQGPQPTGVPVTAQTARGQLSVRRILKYGSAEGEPGMIHEREQAPLGPEAFAVAKDGGILVADVVNQRVLVFSSNGTYVRSIPIPGIALGDVTTDDQGRVYVYDQARRSLHQFDADGTARSSLSLNPADIDTRGYFHIARGSVYFADAAARDVLVATVGGGRLTPPGSSLDRTTEGIHGESGNVYSLSVDKGQALRVQVRDAAAPSASTSLEVALPGIVSARYAGEDQAKRFYVQTERLVGSSIVLEVLAFSSAGEPLGTTRMPENDYAIWTSKLVDVEADGTIVQFLPQQEQAQLNLFAQ